MNPTPKESQPGNNAGDSAEYPTASVILTAQFENLDRVREFAAHHAQACDLDPAAIYEVQLAVDEAFTNIVEHAYGGECLERIECSCQVTPQGLVVIMRDCGELFDPASVPEPDLEAPLEEREIGGLGLFFIRKLMDEVSFSFAVEQMPSGIGRKCNILRMVKHKEKPV